MNDLLWLAQVQMERLRPYFAKGYGSSRFNNLLYIFLSILFSGQLWWRGDEAAQIRFWKTASLPAPFRRITPPQAERRPEVA